MQNLIRVGIVDPHDIVRESLKIFLETTTDLVFVGEACSEIEILPMCQQEKPDVILFDFLESGVEGLEMIKCLRNQFPSILLIVLTTIMTPQQIIRALLAGVAGYLYKQVDIDTLADAIRSVFNGEKAFDDEVERILTNLNDKQLVFRPFYATD